MTLQEQIAALPVDQQLKVATHLLTLALPIWEERMENEGIEYVDSVVGMYHVLDADLVHRIAEVCGSMLHTQGTSGNETSMKEAILLKNKILDPVVALQDGDLDLPEDVLKTLYAAYNLIDHVCGFNQPDGRPGKLGIVSNQAVDALVAAGIWNMDNLVDNFARVLRED